MASSRALLAGLCLVAALMVAVECTHPDQIGALPDMPAFTTNTYSGYLDVTGTQKTLHYFFVESQGTPSSDPLFLWLNGGPGCSSMLGGFTENGPIVTRSGDKEDWQVNAESWNKLANVLYIESPAGVGYSLTNGDSVATDDPHTADDNLSALRSFFTKFPQFMTNDFYIGGESYAGIYVPYLAWYVHKSNERGNSDINLKGIIVGNGCTDWRFDSYPAMVDMAFTHALVSDATAATWHENKCTAPNGVGLLTGGFQYFTLEDNLASSNSAICDSLLNEINKDLDGVNMYGMYQSCYKSSTPEGQYIPCLDYRYVTGYFNRDDVKKALNIPLDAPTWAVCSTEVADHYTQNFKKGSVWAYPLLIKSGYKAWFYSGDTDLAVPYMGSEKWMDALNIGVKSDWRQWDVESQVAGFTKEYNGIKFITVKGAGHMVPQDNPAAAYKIVDAFLNDGDI